MSRPTLVKPPPQDSSKAAIENALELTELADIGPDIFTNTRQLWHPPNARGIYGGAVIAQTLAAAQRTVPSNFAVHSYHCFFVLAGDSATPILYHVERVREGRSFCTRTVQARQRGRPIFTVTCSFMREGSGGESTVSHAATMPAGLEVPPPPGPPTSNSPFVSLRIPNAEDGPDAPPHSKRVRMWVRARGRISEGGGHQAHLSALAYMSDSYFIGTVSRIHRLWRYSERPSDVPSLPEARRRLILDDVACDGSGTDESALAAYEGRPQVGMMVSLDHTIYFHNPRQVRADDWLFVEMESPWAGDGRGVVHQRIFSKDGVLLATCTQEGVVRLKNTNKKAKL